MADNDDKQTDNVTVELLADGIRLGGVDYRRGDEITLPKAHAEVLRAHGSVGPKGTIAKQRQAEADREEAEARHQAALTGVGSFDDARRDEEADRDEDGKRPARPATRPDPRK